MMKARAAMARKVKGALVNQRLMYFGGLQLENLIRVFVVSIGVTTDKVL